MTVLKQVAAWVREELSDELFERWLYDNYEEVERELGAGLALELAALDFRARSGEAGCMRERLAGELALPPRFCLCAAMGERAVTSDDSSLRKYVRSKFVVLQEWLPGYGDVQRLRCRECAQHWCLFRDDDDDYFLRLDREEEPAGLEREEWPAIFLAWLARNREPGRPGGRYVGAETFGRLEISLEAL